MVWRRLAAAAGGWRLVAGWPVVAFLDLLDGLSLIQHAHLPLSFVWLGLNYPASNFIYSSD
jgi:hypothetical protein